MYINTKLKRSHTRALIDFHLEAFKHWRPETKAHERKFRLPLWI